MTPQPPQAGDDTRKIIYSIPLVLIDRYHSQRLIVRTDDPKLLVRLLPDPDPNRLVCVQLLNLSEDTETLIHWGETIPIDIVLANPAAYPRLYRYSKLIDNHPVRVTLPATAEFDKAVKLAGALRFAVKLAVTQPASAEIEGLAKVLDYYLHHGTVSQPIDYFHGLLLAFCHRIPTTLWTIQEEDPTLFRYIDEAGEETLNGRFMGASYGNDLGGFVNRYQQTLLGKGQECTDCRYFACCRGYFKWPNPGYRCDGVKTLFRTLKEAAEELNRDLVRFDTKRAQSQR